VGEALALAGEREATSTRCLSLAIEDFSSIKPTTLYKSFRDLGLSNNAVFTEILE
jgi:hypothetical protein